jgi:predicted dehydrogenase
LKPHIKVGIIGLGHIGEVHIAALERSTRYETILVCDKNPLLAEITPKVPFTTDLSEVTGHPQIDTVIVATPNHTHFEIALEVVRRGKNLIIEKPATASFEELITLEESAKKHGVSVFYAFHSALALDVQWFKQFLKGPGAYLGEISSFQCNFYDPYIDNHKVEQHAIGLENSWRDSGVNALSVLNEFLDLDQFVPTDIYQTPFSHDEIKTSQGLVQFTFQNVTGAGGCGQIDTNWSLGLNKKQTRFGFSESGCTVLLNHSEQRVLIRNADGIVRKAADFASRGPRLLNHYLGVFEQYRDRLGIMEFNNLDSLKIHKLLFHSEEI